MSAFLAAAKRALGESARKRVPMLMQASAGECGAACIAMLASHFGRATSVAEVCAQVDVGRLGLRFHELKSAAEQLGLAARVVKLHDLADLRWLDRPVILHWQFCHFVVLERFDGEFADILDPARGRLRVDRATLSAAYTGLLLWLDAKVEAKPTAPAEPALWPFLRRYLQDLPAWRNLLLASLGMQLLALSPALLSSFAFGALLPAREFGLLALLGIGALFVAVVNPWLEWLRNHWLISLRTQLSARLVGDMCARLLGAEWRALSRRSYGDLLTRMHANDEIRALLSSTGIALLLDLAFLCIGGLVLILAAPAIALLTAAIAGLAAVAIRHLNQRRQQALAVLFSKQSEAQGFLVQMLMGMETVRASGLSERVGARYARIFGEELSETVQLTRIETRISVTALLLNFSAGLLLLAVVCLLYLAQWSSLPSAMVGFSVGLAVLGSAGKLCLGLQHLQSVRFQARLVQEVLDLPQLQTGDRVAPAEPAQGHLHAQDIHFRHAGNAPWALTGIDLDIAPGRMIAIVGASGSGKSTLLSLLAGMHMPASGQLSLDGRDFDTLPPDWLRRQILLVPQFPFFFADSIASNLRFAKADASLAEIRAACALAGIADDIDALPMAYDTLMGEGGSGLSGGQRQRLALARAMLAEPRVLLLDESTSSLDARSEQLVMERLAGFRATRVIAAHRLSTVRSAEHILVLEQGRVVEQGGFQQLCQQAGPFRRLFGRQLAGIETEFNACAF